MFSELKMVEFVVSQKGKNQVCLDGYVYVSEKVCHEKVYWRCSQYTTTFHCRGRLHTVQGVVIRMTSHNHEPFVDDIKFAKSRSKKSKKGCIL